MSAVVTPEAPVAASNPFESCVLLSVTVSLLGISRKVKTVSTVNGNAIPGDGALNVTNDTDATLVRASKQLIECAEYERVKAQAGAISAYCRARAVPGGQRLFKSGTYPIPLERVPEVDEKLEEMVAEFNALAAKFCAVYDERKAEAMQRLGDLAEARDYPPVARVRQAFAVTTAYTSYGPPRELEAVSSQMNRREWQKFQKACRAAAQEVQVALRAMFQELVDHAVERLTPEVDANGKPRKKVFRDTLITNMKEFLGEFSSKNVTNDAELAVLVEKVRSAMTGRDADTLRKSDDARTITARALATVKEEMDRMIGPALSRKITLTDE